MMLKCAAEHSIFGGGVGDVERTQVLCWERAFIFDVVEALSYRMQLSAGGGVMRE